MSAGRLLALHPYEKNAMPCSVDLQPLAGRSQRVAKAYFSSPECSPVKLREGNWAPVARQFGPQVSRFKNWRSTFNFRWIRS
jgi:hypothetical protein